MESEGNRQREEVDAAGPEITIRLDCFEGPLDLLLHLIKREEIDIWNIPIARITEQYLEYLEWMRDLNINVAGEWLVMAATLIYIKSRMLLPPDPSAESAEEEREDPRTELVYQLLEHQKFKAAAQMLHTREEIESSVWSSPPPEVLEEGKEAVAVTLFDLLKAFHDVVRRFEDRNKMQIAAEEVSIEQAMEEIRLLLLVHESVSFSTFFENALSRQHLIVTFLALLELVRLEEVRIRQRRAFGEIRIGRCNVSGGTA